MNDAGTPPTLPLIPTVPPPLGMPHLTNVGIGFEADSYSDWIDESMSWKQTCYVGDWSPLLLKLRVTGPDAMRFFADISINDFSRLAVGRARHIVLCNDTGKVMGDGVLMRLGADDLLFTSGPGVPWASWCLAHGTYDVEARDESMDRFIFQVQGPESLRVLEELTGTDLRGIEFMGFAEREYDGMRFDVLRQGMAGELGYELHGRFADSNRMWDAIVSAGTPHGLRRLGARAKMVNHVEACFPTPSVDYIPAWFAADVLDFGESMAASEMPMWDFVSNHAGSLAVAGVEDLYFSPVELGWGRAIDVKREFRGRDALVAELAEPRRHIVTLVWDAEDVADVWTSLLRDGEPFEQMEMPRGPLGCVRADRVLAGDIEVGISVSRCYSYFFRQMLSLGVIDVARTEPGTRVEVVWGAAGFPEKKIKATVAPAPYKPDNRRVDVSLLPTYI